MYQATRTKTSTMVTNRHGENGSTPPPEEVREALRKLGTLALKLADGQTTYYDELIGQLDRTPTSSHNTIPVASNLLTLTEACTRLRISKWSIYKLIHERELITVKIGTRRFVPVSEVDRFTEELISAGGHV